MDGPAWGTKHKLPEELDAACVHFAKQCVEGYRRKQKEASRSLARPGIDLSIWHQAQGKLGECLFCLAAGLDPLQALDWTDKLDDGHDVDYRNRRIDVKTSEVPFLMWPVTKAWFIKKARCDIFVAVRSWRKATEKQLRDGARITNAEFQLVGWITRNDYIRKHKTVGAEHGWMLHKQGEPRNKYKQPGSWYVLDEGTPYLSHFDLRELRILFPHWRPVETPPDPEPRGEAMLDYHNNHLCHCGRYGSRAQGFNPIKELVWFCFEHDPEQKSKEGADRSTPSMNGSSGQVREHETLASQDGADEKHPGGAPVLNSNGIPRGAADANCSLQGRSRAAGAEAKAPSSSDRTDAQPSLI